MAASVFRIKNGLSVGATDVINSSGAWIGPQTNVAGPAGPQGPTGPQGANGPQGATGPQGAPSGGGSLATTVSALGVGTAAGPSGEIRATTQIIAFYSDIRLKDNIESIKNAGEKLYSLNGVFYTQNKLAKKYGYNDYSQQVGLFAQEVQKVLPEVVGIAPFDREGKDKSKSGEYFLTISYEKIIPLIIETIKEQQEEIDSLEKVIL